VEGGQKPSLRASNRRARAPGKKIKIQSGERLSGLRSFGASVLVTERWASSCGSKLRRYSRERYLSASFNLSAGYYQLGKKTLGPPSIRGRGSIRKDGLLEVTPGVCGE